MLSRRPRPTESFSFLRASSIFLSFRFQVFSFLSIALRAYRADDRDTERVLPDDGTRTPIRAVRRVVPQYRVLCYGHYESGTIQRGQFSTTAGSRARSCRTSSR